MTAEQQERARQKADAAYRRRNYPPEAVAKAIVRAVDKLVARLRRSQGTSGYAVDRRHS